MLHRTSRRDLPRPIDSPRPPRAIACRHRCRASWAAWVLGFVGPLFWPYAYEDFVDYTFWPYAYDTFWPYAFDDVFEGIYGTEGAYAYAGSAASGAAYASSRRRRTAALTAGSWQICSGQAQGLTDFPIERIAQQAELDQPQRALLDDLKAATAEAVSILQAACPSTLPSTPTGRIAAMRTRVGTMLQAVQVVRPALEKFYQSLSDEQKERFNGLDQGNEMAGRQQPDVTGLCSQRTARVRTAGRSNRAHAALER